jgi:MFS family permease
MWTFYLVSMCGTAQMAMASGIDLMQHTVFPDKSLSAIQTAMSLPSLLSVVTGILSAVLVGAGIASKKTLTVIGVMLVALVGVLAPIFHTQFWQIIAFSVMIGLGMGLLIPTSQSIMMDNFDEKERQLISGFQFSFINLGGIIMSVLGGLMITLVWYGGYLLCLLLVPIAILAIIVLPKERRYQTPHDTSSPNAPVKAGRSKLPVAVAYYAAALFLFSLMYNVSAGNLSTHLAVNGLGNSATTGIATAVLMAGGVVSGTFFNKLSVKLDDHMIPLAFFILFLGYTLLNLFTSSLVLVLISVFVAGTAVCLCMPQCVFSVSKVVDPTNSAMASTIIASVAPGFGGFLSPVVFTNLTQWLGGSSTQFRFQFVGFIALAAAVFYFLNNVRRGRKRAQAEAVID